MAHPDLEHAVAFGRGEILNAIKQTRVAARTHLGVAKLTMVGVCDLATEVHGHGLHAIANPKHRHTLLKCRCRHL